MNDSILVVATLHPVPLEDGTGRIAQDDPPRLVPNTLYYRRRLRSEELRIAQEEASAPDQAADTGTTSGRQRNRQPIASPAPVAASDRPNPSSEDAV